MNKRKKSSWQFTYWGGFKQDGNEQNEKVGKSAKQKAKKMKGGRVGKGKIDEMREEWKDWTYGTRTGVGGRAKEVHIEWRKGGRERRVTLRATTLQV